MHSSTLSLCLGLLLSANYLVGAYGISKRDTGFPSFQQRALCSPGTWSETGNTPCTPCTPGSFASASGSHSCTLARPGRYVRATGATSDRQCDEGTYTSTPGATECLPCPAGSECPDEGTSNPRTCPAGTFSHSGADECEDCDEGTYAPTPGSTQCLPCPAGSECSDDGVKNPRPCPAGTFSRSGADECEDCPAGTFTSSPGSSACCTCCAGFYSTGARTSCTKCPTGTPFSAPGSRNQGACSASGTTTPAMTCQQDPATHVCPVPTGLPSGVLTRANVRRQVCPKSTQKNCPVYRNTKGTAMLAGYECVDVVNDLESCGGCVSFSRDGRKSEDGGRDCSAIPGVDTVRCASGKCVIKSCRSGYRKARFGDGCIPTTSFLEQSRRGLRG